MTARRGAGPVLAAAALAVCLLLGSGTQAAPDPAPTRGPLLFVGASYTAGVGASSRAHHYPTLVGRHLHRRIIVAAVPGTGFVRGGRRAFGPRIARLPTSMHPSLLLIQGGRNDQGVAPDRLRPAVLRTIRLAQRRFPYARIVVLGPIPGALPVGARLLATDATLSSACHQAGAGYLDPVRDGWITRANLPGLAGRVARHPNDRGYAYIAQRLDAALPRMLPSHA